MNFGTAVKSALSKYASFEGRARRSEYWWFFLFTVVVSVLANVVDLALDSSVVSIVVALAFFLPSLAVLVRRLHDTDRSGGWFFIGLIPVVGTIVLLVFLCKEGDVDRNRYGTSPKAAFAGSDPSTW